MDYVKIWAELAKARAAIDMWTNIGCLAMFWFVMFIICMVPVIASGAPRKYPIVREAILGAGGLNFLVLVVCLIGIAYWQDVAANLL